MDTLPAITPAPAATSPQSLVLEASHVYKSFGSNHVLMDINFQLYKGENVVILGKSGSGKSVFIKCVIGLLQPDEGSIVVLEQDITSLRNEALDHLRAKVGFLFQSNALYDSMTVRENLEFPMRRHWLAGQQRNSESLVQEVLENVGLAHTINMMPAELSGGMRKRIALARTLILNPEIILYDEPTTGLDPITAREIGNLMLEMGRKYNTSAVIISHDMNCIKLVADRIVLLYDGKAYANGTYEELRRSQDNIVKQFFE
jgi:phospholipid/cholesterol/gamma-HCH transport system ATP-binding protein